MAEIQSQDLSALTPLYARPAPPPVPLDLGDAMRTAQKFRQEQQIGAQSLQSGDLDLQQKQRDLNDQNIFSAAMNEAGGDPDKALMLAAQRGMTGKGLMGVQQTLLKNRETQSTITKNTGEGNAAEAQAADKRNGIISDTTGSLLNLPPEQRPAAYPAARQQLITQGHLDPSEAPPDYAAFGGDAKLQQVHDQFTTAVAKAAQLKAAQDLIDQKAEAGRKAALAPPILDKANSDAQVAASSSTEAATKLLAQQAANAPNPDAYNALIDAAPHGAAKNLPSSDKVFDANGKMTRAGLAAVNNAGMTSVERSSAAQAADTAAEDKRHHLSDEATAALNASIAAGRLKQEQTVNGMKYGPGTQEYWVQQLQENPDSIKEMPPELRSSVGQQFKAATGLPLPTPVSAATQTQETAARNAIDGIGFIRDALKDPEIAKNIGPIMGRLGETQQDLGTSLGLSPAAAAKVQELRTRMRYFVFQEGKAVLGGRLPQQLMDQLSSSSANVKMDTPTLNGALNGAESNAQDVMTNADKQRFGGQARPPAMRNAVPPATPAAQTAAIPAAVKTVLSGLKPGIHKLSDGTTWMKGADGTITKR